MGKHDLDDGRTDVSVFLQPSSSIPSFVSPPIEVYEYVERCANEIGSEIRSNRGLPPTASPHNMFSLTEKAVIILGLAFGVPLLEVLDRINVVRIAAGKELCDRNGNVIRVYQDRYSNVIARVRQDVFAGMEKMSPLVSPQLRIMHRGTLLEYYRVKMMQIIINGGDVQTGDIDKDGNPVTIAEEIAVAKLDRAMQPHLKFFDRLASSGPDGMKGLMAPSEQVRKAREADARAEEMIQKKFAQGLINDEQRIELLREIRHGVGETPEEDDVKATPSRDGLEF